MHKLVGLKISIRVISFYKQAKKSCYTQGKATCMVHGSVKRSGKLAVAKASLL